MGFSKVLQSVLVQTCPSHYFVIYSKCIFGAKFGGKKRDEVGGMGEGEDYGHKYCKWSV